VAYETEDTVSSAVFVRDGDGNEWQPADYLDAFATFVRDHADQIEAIRILLDRPQGWSTDALKELRNQLAAARPRFTVDNLQLAHERHYHKALADIISMVKRAAVDTSPLLTAEERVSQAVDRVVAGRTLSEAQVKWIEYIRQHLVANLSIERDDFEAIPVLSDHGGWGRANRVFEGQLAELIDKLNEELVAA
jgi:type I restriction enzyme R subunit